jgi:hypothetical protein
LAFPFPFLPVIPRTSPAPLVLFQVIRTIPDLLVPRSPHLTRLALLNFIIEMFRLSTRHMIIIIGWLPMKTPARCHQSSSSVPHQRFTTDLRTERQAQPTSISLRQSPSSDAMQFSYISSLLIHIIHCHRPNAPARLIRASRLCVFPGPSFQLFISHGSDVPVLNHVRHCCPNPTPAPYSTG